jgi:Fe-S oxidoreductase
LRLALTGQLGADAMAGEAVADAMKLCVSCKACRRECPTGVDMARMKIEVLAAQAERSGFSLRDRVIANLPRIGFFASRAPSLANFTGDRFAHGLGFTRGKKLPRWHKAPFRDDEADSTGDVLLLADTFNRYFEPENLRAAIRVLRAAGLRVAVPGERGRPLCCGRTYLGAGMISRARAEARRTIRALAGGKTVIGLEPSCLLTLRDEFAALLPGGESADLASRALLFSEFFQRENFSVSLKSIEATARVHGHCHQKSFGAFPAAVAMLRRVPDLAVAPITSSCCGMAGSFGYQAETAEVSRAMAEAGLLPAVRAAAADDIIVADGTSCRHQIRGLAGREAVHSVRVMERALPG